jgi:RNA polymerase sigma factor (sigma-70 family)
VRAGGAFQRVMDDIQLARRLADELDAGFELLVGLHADRVYSIALRLTGNPEDAEEIAQDVFVRAYRALDRYEAARVREIALRPWLATITVNAARSRRRKTAEREPAVPLNPSHAAILRAAARTQPEALVVRRWERHELAASLASLPDRYRVPIVLRYVDDLSYPEMSQALGRPEGTLKAQVHRGLALLRAARDAAQREEMTA